MNQRFFRATDSVYELVRVQLDAAIGYPNEMAVTSFQPASDAPHDEQGRAYVAVWDFFCGYPGVATLLPELLFSGAVEEISASDYATTPIRSPYLS